MGVKAATEAATQPLHICITQIIHFYLTQIKKTMGRLLSIIYATLVLYALFYFYYFSIFETTQKKTSGRGLRIVGVGDLHGDYQNTLRVLRMAEIINENLEWIAADTVLVQTGDIVDRGHEALNIYQLFDNLKIQAAIAGGKVVLFLYFLGLLSFRKS